MFYRIFLGAAIFAFHLQFSVQYLLKCLFFDFLCLTIDVFYETIFFFQAANPGCVLEDFVKWYSPRDWIEEEVEENGVTVVKGITLPKKYLYKYTYMEIHMKYCMKYFRECLIL